LQVTNITKLKVKYKIDLENGKHFYVSEDTIIKYGLIKKIDLSKEQLKEIIAHESVESAYSKAVHYLQFGLRTKQDIRAEIFKAMPYSLTLGLGGITLAAVLGFFTGYLAALKKGGFLQPPFKF